MLQKIYKTLPQNIMKMAYDFSKTFPNVQQQRTLEQGLVTEYNQIYLISTHMEVGIHLAETSFQN